MQNQFSGIDTDETLREKARHGRSDYPFQYYLENIRDFDFHRVDWHWHPEVEFVYIKEGAAVCHIGADSHNLCAGTGLFINSGIVHRFESNSDCIIPNIVFSPKLLAAEDSLIYRKYIIPVVNSQTDHLIFDPSDDHDRKILDIMQEIFLKQDNTETRELQTVSSLMELWSLIYSGMDHSAKQNTRSASRSSQARLQIMMQYIHGHFMEMLTLDDIARSVSISPSHALLIFQNYIHTSPVSYLIGCRIKHAAFLLLSTEKKVNAIAYESGFNSCEYFCRKFKQLYQMTPSEYRKTRLT